VQRGDDGQGNVGGSGGPRTIRVVMPRTPWDGYGAADRVVPGSQGSDDLRPRSRGRGEATGRSWVAWGSLGMSGEGAHHDEHALAAVRTGLPGAAGGHQQSGGWLSRAGAVGGGAGVCPASARWSGCRRGRWTGLHSPSYRTVWTPWGNPCGRQRRITSWAGRVMVCPRED
jgi:hypothetical protein